MKKSTLFAFLIIAVSLLCFSNKIVHEYYISITSIDYNVESKSLEITQQFIAHDVEEAILKEYDIDLNLSEANEHPEADNYLIKYVNSRFKLTTDKEIKLTWVGKEVNLDETLYLYFQSNEIEKPSSLSVVNTCLTEVFHAQSNITHVNFAEKQLTQSFHQQKKTHTFIIK